MDSILDEDQTGLELEEEFMDTEDTNNILMLNTDMLSVVMQALPVSQEQITLLRTARRANKRFRDAIDICLQSDRWALPLRALAADFHSDFAKTNVQIHPPMSLFRGIARMIEMREYTELVTGMREYLSNQTTQEIIILKLMESLAISVDANVNERVAHQALLRTAQDAGVPGMVAWGMRCHTQCRSIQRNGIVMLGYFEYGDMLQTYRPNGDEEENCLFQVYLIGSIGTLMYETLADRDIQKTCLQALQAIIVRVSDELVDPEKALMRPGTHNILNLIINSMEEHVGDVQLVLLGAKTLYAWARLLNEFTLTVELVDFDILKAQNVTIHSLQQHSVQESKLAGDCILALHELFDHNFQAMTRSYDAMQCAINAVQAHMNDVELIQHMQNLFYTIMSRMECYHFSDSTWRAAVEEESQRMQDFVASRGGIQLTLSSLLHAARSNVDTQVETEDTFDMIFTLCKGNPRTTALVADAGTIKIMEEIAPLIPRNTPSKDRFLRNQPN